MGIDSKSKSKSKSAEKSVRPDGRLTAVIYARYSSDGQREEYLSLSRSQKSS